MIKKNKFFNHITLISHCVIFLNAATDMIAARIIYYKMQADSFMNRGWISGN